MVLHLLLNGIHRHVHSTTMAVLREMRPGKASHVLMTIEAGNDWALYFITSPAWQAQHTYDRLRI